MPITTKAEAEALTVPELKAELESRGLPTLDLKEAGMLEALVAHLDGATNGAAAVEAAAEPAVEAKKDDAAPTEAAAEPAAEKADADPEVTEVPAPAVAAETAAPASDVAVATTEEVEEVPAPTRALDEVSGSTEEPDSKKAKAVAPEETAEPAKTVETAVEAPASEPAAAPTAE